MSKLPAGVNVMGAIGLPLPQSSGTDRFVFDPKLAVSAMKLGLNIRADDLTTYGLRITATDEEWAAVKVLAKEAFNYVDPDLNIYKTPNLLVTIASISVPNFTVTTSQTTNVISTYDFSVNGFSEWIAAGTNSNKTDE